jgi:hypothetical protein
VDTLKLLKRFTYLSTVSFQIIQQLGKPQREVSQRVVNVFIVDGFKINIKRAVIVV